MWTPPERIKHALPEVRWPTGGGGGALALVQPGRASVRSRRAQRTWVPAMVPWRATDDGFVTPDVLDWYGRFADGRPGVHRRRGDRHPRRARRGRCCASATIASSPG